ncbi:MAG: invasion associated locus B family protein [Oceanicola sp.]|jgi:invasion protein IalB|nr:invasion associated locus B family protein [Oceanicola sp.]
MIRQTLFALGATTLIAAAGMASAQDVSTNQVANKTDWSVFVDGDPKECWGVSAPTETLNTRDDRIVSVRRGDILLFVVFRPGDNVKGEVAFTGGYPFAEGSTVDVQIGDSSFEFTTSGEWAWPSTTADDANVVAAMKRGRNAVLVARSSRGTRTQDTFSLLGFTAALDEAEKRCAS